MPSEEGTRTGCQLGPALIRQENAKKDERDSHWHELLTLQNGFRSVSFYFCESGGQLLFPQPFTNMETEHRRFIACPESTCLKQ